MIEFIFKIANGTQSFKFERTGMDTDRQQFIELLAEVRAYLDQETIVEVRADGLELGWIGSHFNGLPQLYPHGLTRWTGDHAWFIAANLPVSDEK